MKFNEIFECFMDFGFSYDDKFLVSQLVYHIMTDSVFTPETEAKNTYFALSLLKQFLSLSNIVD